MCLDITDEKIEETLEELLHANDKEVKPKEDSSIEEEETQDVEVESKEGKKYGL